MKKSIIIFITAILTLNVSAQSKAKKIYDETIDPVEQINDAVKKAEKDDKFVICQVGGNWCRWCLLFADFISNDSEISSFIKKNFEYIHVNYNPRERGDKAKSAKTDAMLKSLGSPERFGFPVFVVLDGEGKVIHIQDSSYLEEGNGYNKDKVMRFFSNWTPEAVNK